METADRVTVPAPLRLAAAPRDLEARSLVNRPIRVLLADDHPIVRRSLWTLLDREADVEVVAEAPSLANCLSHVDAYQPDVLVLDLRLASGSSLESIRKLRTRGARPAVVVLTMTESPLIALKALEAGATAFVLKDRADSELLPAIRQAANGEEFISPRVSEGLHALRRATGGQLTVRETEVLRLIAFGHTSAEIAHNLQLSTRTVETARAEIYRKLGLKTRAELVQVALRRHMIGN